MESLGLDSKLSCNGFVSYDWKHVARVFRGDFTLEMHGRQELTISLTLDRKYRHSSEAETVLSSQISEVTATTEYKGKPVKIRWLPGQQEFTMEEA